MDAAADPKECTAQAPPLTWRQRLRARTYGRLRLQMIPGYGVTYRMLNRLGHRLHIHYMPPRYMPDGSIGRRCQWCGVAHYTSAESALLMKSKSLILRSHCR